MNKHELKKEMEDLIRLTALLFAAISWASAAAALLLILSLFVNVALPVAFPIQMIAGAVGAGLSIWRTS